MKKEYRYFKIFIISFALLFVLFTTISCEKQYINFGSGFIDNTITNLILVDSSTVKVSTVYVDSFVSSNTNIIYAGKFADEQFGKVSAQSFLQLGLPSSTKYDMPNGSVFDSMEVILKLNKSFYGDTLSPYKISVFQLNTPITYANEQQYAFFNTDSRTYNSTALGSTQLTVKPFSRDTIAIKLSQTLGQDLFNKLQNQDPVGQTLSEFIAYFKGLAIVGGSTNNLILGFGDSLKMRMHYHKPSVFEQPAIIDFGINQVNYQFNNITIDRTGSAIASISHTNNQLPSASTLHAGFSQYITGSVVKLSFPYLSNLYQLPNFIKIIKAQLIIRPLQNSYQGNYHLPSRLRLSVTDQNNYLGSDLTVSSGSSNVVQYGNLFIDNLYGTQTAYTYDITNYLQAQMATTGTNQNGLLILPNGQAATFNRILIADGTNTNNKTEVKIYYASIK